MLEDINAFCCIVKCKSFAKAAKHLKISTPVITRRLARLEKKLDARLLHRTTRQVTLTEAGSVFYEEVTGILDALALSQRNVKSLSKEVAGVLKIGIPASLSYLYLTQAFNEFTEQFPHISLHIINGNHLLDLLSNGFDLVIHCGELPNSNFYYKKIGQWEKITCAAPAYLAARGTPKVLEDLAAHNCLDHSDNFNLSWKFQEKGKSKYILVTGNVRSSSSIDLKNLAISGVGIVHLPSFTVANEIKSGQLVSVLDAYKPPALGLYAVYPTNKYLTRKAQVFLQFFTKLLKPVLNV